jgi:hypothetical protein
MASQTSKHLKPSTPVFNPDTLTPEALSQKEIFLVCFVPTDRPVDVDLRLISEYYICFADAPNVYYQGFDFKRKISGGVLDLLEEQKKTCKLKRTVRLEYPNTLWIDSHGNLVQASASGTQDGARKPIATPQFYE